MAAGGRAGESANVGGDVAGAAPLGRFHAAVVAFQRARQLQNNARPRIESDGHKFHRLALMEVMAGTVSWSVEELPVVTA